MPQYSTSDSYTIVYVIGVNGPEVIPRGRNYALLLHSKNRSFAFPKGTNAASVIFHGRI